MDIAIGELLAHEAPMILIDRVLEVGEGKIHTSVTIRPNSPFAKIEGVPVYVSVEFMAQSIAAFIGWSARQQGEPPKIGLLLGTRKLELSTDWMRFGDDIEIQAFERYNDGTMAAFECLVRRGDETLAEARLNVYEPPDSSLTDRIAAAEQREANFEKET